MTKTIENARLMSVLESENKVSIGGVNFEIVEDHNGQKFIQMSNSYNDDIAVGCLSKTTGELVRNWFANALETL